MRKRGLLALSLANLCFLPVWEKLLTQSPASYFMELPPPPAAFVAVLLNVLVLATVFLLVGTAVSKFRSARWRESVGGAATFVIAIVAIVDGVRRSRLVPSLSYFQFRALEATLVIVIVCVALRWGKRLARAAALTATILLPTVILTFGQALWTLATYPAVLRASAAPLASPIADADRSSSRVVWLLFDEMDEELAFAHRPAGLSLPELDRFRAEAISASDAHPVAGETELAMPALIMGRAVSKAESLGPSTLMVTLADSGQVVDWRSQPNLFTQARAAGFDAAVVGFYHPYCRVLAQALSVCMSRGGADAFGLLQSRVFTVFDNMLIQSSDILQQVPEATSLGLTTRVLHAFDGTGAKHWRLSVDRYLGILEQAEEVVVRRDLRLVLIHFSVPHWPFIYDRSTGLLNVDASRGTYLDNLALADRALGILRKNMEDAGVWEESTVLVTSDHWYRGKASAQPAGNASNTNSDVDHRVPLLLKLPGQRRGVTFEAAFNTVITHDLILELLAHGMDVSGPEAVVRWLDDHRTQAPPFCNEARNCR
jgi:hypothetical protein